MALVIVPPQRINASSTVLSLNEQTNIDVKALYDGVEFAGFACAVPCVQGIDVCNDAGFPTTTVTKVTYASKPFSLKQVYRCGTMGLDAEAFKKEAVDHFNAGLHKSLAAAIWKGPDTSKGLTDVPVANRLVNTNGVATGVALLSQALASAGTGSQGVIHMTVLSATAAVHRGVVYRAGRDLRTVVGDHLVIADGGYTGSAPTDVGPAAGYEWVYATGAVGYKIDDVNVYDSYHRGANYYEVFVETSAVAFWDECGWFGVPVNISCDLGCGV